MIPACRHIKSNGARCRAHALSDRPYCYHHDRLHRVFNKQKSTKKTPSCSPLEDRSSILMALSDVICGLASGRVDSRNAGRLIYGLQVAGQFAPDSSCPNPDDAVESLTITKPATKFPPATEFLHCGRPL